MLLTSSATVIADAKSLCGQLLDRVCEQEDHAFLVDAVGGEWTVDDDGLVWDRTRRHVLIDLLNVYKGFVPDLRFQIREQVSEDGTLVTYWSARGRHLGTLLGVPPSRQEITLRGVLVAKCACDGRIERFSGTWDCSSFCRQVGITLRQLNRLLQPSADAIAVRTIVERPGRPILLFPTMSLPGWLTWRRFIAELRPRRPVVTFQLLGNRLAFEDSPVPATYSIRGETSAVTRALAAARLKGPFDVVGHSAGGAVALDFALERSAHVRTLTLIEPSVPWVLSATNRLDRELCDFMRERVAHYSQPITADRYAAFLRQSMGGDYEPLKSPSWPLLRAYMRNMSFRAALYTHDDTADRLRAAKFPVLLVQGTGSDRFHHEIIAGLRSAFAKASTLEMPQRGHAPHHGAGMNGFLKALARFHDSPRRPMPEGRGNERLAPDSHAHTVKTHARKVRREVDYVQP